MVFQKCAVIGLGLIGGSLAAAIKARSLANEVVATTLREDHLQIAQHYGYIDHGFLDIQSCVKGADLIVIAAPVAAFETIFQTLGTLSADWLAPSVIITDVGSVKGNVVTLARRYIPELCFVPGHPIAGSEKSGIQAVNPDIFEKHMVVLTPEERPPEERPPEERPGDRTANYFLNYADSVERIKNLWQEVGAKVLTMPVDEHDRVFAVTSHLPHLLAFSLVDTLAGDPDQQDIFQFAAGGFRDFTRIAASDPTMWHDIFFSNKKNILAAIDEFSQGLHELKQALKADDHETILGILSRSQHARQHFQVVLEKRSFTSLNDIELTNSHIPDKYTTDKYTTESKSTMNQTDNHQHFLLQPGGQCTGDIRVPGDKSISHRSIMFGALAEGVTRISGFLEGEDALATLQAFRDMGVVIEGPKDGEVTVHGVGMHGLRKPAGDIYVGNSGTTIRLMTGLLAAQQFETKMIGDDTIMRRPMARVANPVNCMGAQISISEKGTPPVEIKPAPEQLQAIHYDMPVVSAQVKSAILLAGLYAKGTTTIREAGPSRDHTERMLKAFGCTAKVDGYDIELKGEQTLKGIDMVVPADISSAAFFMVGASIAPGSNLCLKNVGMNPTRSGVVEILRLMGGNITLENERRVGGEPVADIRVKSAQLKGIHIPEALVPLAIDEFPAIFIAAACAKGVTRLTGAEELRVKESDRIASMANGLQVLGIEAEAQPDGIIIKGVDHDDQTQPVFGGGEIETYGDHRIAMSFSMAALRASQPIVVKDIAHVATSFPGFMDVAQLAGMSVTLTT